MSRDRFVKTEWGNYRTGARVGDHGYDDNGHHLDGQAEALVYAELKAQGYQVYKHGWPDFMAIRGDEVRLIEVKSSGDRQRERQVRNHKALARLGVLVETIIKIDPSAERFRAFEVAREPTIRKVVV